MSTYQMIAGGIITAIFLGFVAYVVVLVTMPNLIWRPRDRCTLIESDPDASLYSTRETRARANDGQ